MGQDTTVSELFIRYGRDRISSLISYREGETKLGERVGIAEAAELSAALAASPARYVLIGIPEDIGVRANGGIGGAHTLWEPALKALLNIQSTDTFSGEELLVLGAFNFDAWMEGTLTSPPEVLRNFVAWIDDAVWPVVSGIVGAGKIPIVIGGGHNNAYPLIKGASHALGHKIHCMNLDAHSDYRMLEGRHSGNGFRYAKLDGYLDKYAVIGLHRNYNAAGIIRELTNHPDLHFSYYDDLLLQTLTFQDAVSAALRHVAGTTTGIELDMDCIAGVLASAATPSGLHALSARQYVCEAARQTAPAYLHITEGATMLRDGRQDPGAAKLAAYLISDFIRATEQKARN